MIWNKEYLGIFTAHQAHCSVESTAQTDWYRRIDGDPIIFPTLEMAHWLRFQKVTQSFKQNR
ncbi:uncharacterized protein LOC111103731 isoform X2 [Crassostrea virginica]